MQFIEVTEKYNEKRVSLNVSVIREVIEKEDGCFITTAEDVKKGLRGWSVKESYTEVCRMIADKIF